MGKIKVDANYDEIHDDKHRLSAKLLDQPVIDPGGDIGTIFTQQERKILLMRHTMVYEPRRFYAFSR